MFEDPQIVSPYQGKGLGVKMYEQVIKISPEVVIEFGTRSGYYTLCIAQALRDLKKGRLISYDIFEKNPTRRDIPGFNFFDISKDINRLIKLYNLQEVSVSLKQVDFFSWIENPEECDLLILDIDNNKEKVELALNRIKSPVMFEGGVQGRFSLSPEYKYEEVYSEFPGLCIRR